MKSTKWQLEEAENKFSEVIRKAAEEGPQTIIKHGKDSIIVISAEDYKMSERPSNSFVDFIQQSPLASVELDLERDKSPVRDFSL